MRLRKNGFSSVFAIIVLFLISAMAGTLMDRVSAKFKPIADNTRLDLLAIAARYGIRSAEDWLLGAISRGNIPERRKGAASSQYERIELFLPDDSPGGEKAECKSPFAGIEIELYVAEASYGPDVFADGAVSIPDIPEKPTPLGIKRHYFLRSLAVTGDGAGGIVCEELISVTIAADRIMALERVFFRSRPKLE